MPTIIAEALIVRDNKLLLVQQRKRTAVGLWGCPGGHVEAGETLQEAVEREVAEEIGSRYVGAELFRTSRFQDEGQDVELRSFMGSWIAE